MPPTAHPWDNFASKEGMQTITRAKLTISQGLSWNCHCLKRIFSFKVMGAHIITFNFINLRCNPNIRNMRQNLLAEAKYYNHTPKKKKNRDE